MSKLVLSSNRRTRLLRAGTGGVEGGPAVEISPKTVVYTGTYYEFIVPADVYALTADLFGAEGGSSSSGPANQGGNGGQVKCDVAVVPAEVLRIYVGGTTATVAGGFNGGGGGIGSDGGGGGGATDIRRSPYGLADRLVIAGGGGGAGGNDSKVNANGVGGTPAGGQGSVADYGTSTGGGGGTASAGGAAGTGAAPGAVGTLGVGGAGANTTRNGGGGGGGRYGGGGGGCANAGGTSGSGGGGGSGLSTGLNETLVSGTQTGNGVATLTWPPATFSPIVIGGLTCWLDASDTTKISHVANAVDGWTDKRGLHSFSQSTAGMKPTTNTRTINGKNAIDFDGTTDNLIASPWIWANRGVGNTIFIVCQSDIATGTSFLIADGRTVSNSTQWGVTLEFSTFYRPRATYTRDDGAALASLLGPTAVVTTGPTLITHTQQIQSDTVSQWSIGQNAETRASATNFATSQAATTPDLCTIGAHRRPSPGVSFFDGAIAEILVYSGILTAPNIATIEAYLKAKWGTP